MAKSISINDNGKEYILEFSRRTVKMLSARGFELDRIGSDSARMVPMLFHGAFLKNHPNISLDKTEEIYKRLNPESENVMESEFGDAENIGILSVLIEMYADVMRSIVEPGGEGNTTWRVSE